MNSYLYSLNLPKKEKFSFGALRSHLGGIVKTKCRQSVDEVKNKRIRSQSLLSANRLSNRKK